MGGKVCRVPCRVAQAKEDPRGIAKVSIKFSSDTPSVRDAAKVAQYLTVASPDALPISSMLITFRRGSRAAN